MKDHDLINHPAHYTCHPSGVEHIEITEHMGFCLGNAIKYLWRAGNKGGIDDEIKDLKKAVWYIEREIRRIKSIPVPESGRAHPPEEVRVSGVPYSVDAERLTSPEIDPDII